MMRTTKIHTQIQQRERRARKSDSDEHFTCTFSVKSFEEKSRQRGQILFSGVVLLQESEKDTLLGIQDHEAVVLAECGDVELRVLHNVITPMAQKSANFIALRTN
jgi:hypothetical protein